MEYGIWNMEYSHVCREYTIKSDCTEMSFEIRPKG